MVLCSLVMLGVRGQVQLACNDTVTICSALQSCCCPVPLNLCACCTIGGEICNNGVCEAPSVSPTPTASATGTPSPTAVPSRTPSPSAQCASLAPVGANYQIVSCGVVQIIINASSDNRTLVVDPGVVVEGNVQLELAVVVVASNVTGGVNITGSASQLFINNTALIILGPPAGDGDFVPLFTVESGNITVGDNVTIQFDGGGKPTRDKCEYRTAETQRRGNTLGVLFTVDSSACTNGKNNGHGLGAGEIVAIVVSISCCLAILCVVCGVLVMCILLPRCSYLKTSHEKNDLDSIVSSHPSALVN